MPECYRKHKWTLLPHPPQSPDLNPIEHLWDELDRRVEKKFRNSLVQFRERVFKLWEEIPKCTLEKLVDSMSDRLKAVIQAKGMHTRY